MAKDLVCGMNANEKKALKKEYQGKIYYFCSLGCKQTVEKNPKKFIKK